MAYSFGSRQVFCLKKQGELNDDARKNRIERVESDNLFFTRKGGRDLCST